MSDFETLILPDTGLEFDGEQLVREDDAGQRTFACPAVQLQKLQYKKTINWLGLIIASVGIMIGFVAYEVAEQNLVQVLLYIIAIPITGFGFLLSRGDTILIETKTDSLSFEASDSGDVVEGFVASVNAFLADQKDRPAT